MHKLGIKVNKITKNTRNLEKQPSKVSNNGLGS